MKIFKEIIGILCNRLGVFAYGWAIVDLFSGRYKSAAWILFVASTLFLVRHIIELCNDIKEDF